METCTCVSTTITTTTGVEYVFDDGTLIDTTNRAFNKRCARKGQPIAAWRLASPFFKVGDQALLRNDASKEQYRTAEVKKVVVELLPM